jgi:hypothetical protein
VIEIICIAIAVIAVAYSVTCYYKLWQWARITQHIRIAIAYKGRVKSDVPIVEWILWAGQLDKDRDAGGRVVFRMDKVSLSLIKRAGTQFGPGQFVREVGQYFTKFIPKGFFRSKKPEPPSAENKVGHWKGTQQEEKVTHE